MVKNRNASWPEQACYQIPGCPRLVRKRLGPALTMMTLVRLKTHGAEIIRSFGRGMARLDEVSACLQLSGEYDFILQVRVDSPEAYEDFLRQKLLHLPVVDKIHSALVLRETIMNGAARRLA